MKLWKFFVNFFVNVLFSFPSSSFSLLFSISFETLSKLSIYLSWAFKILYLLEFFKLPNFSDFLSSSNLFRVVLWIRQVGTGFDSFFQLSSVSQVPRVLRFLEIENSFDFFKFVRTFLKVRRVLFNFIQFVKFFESPNSSNYFFRLFFEFSSSSIFLPVFQICQILRRFVRPLNFSKRCCSIENLIESNFNIYTDYQKKSLLLGNETISISYWN